MNYLQRKSGASLLTILLLVAVVGVMVLAGSKALQESTRTSAVLSTREEAKHMAQTGFEEALLYLNSGSSLLVEGEYGTITDRTAGTSYSLTPMRRGFSDVDTCATQTAAEAVNASSSTIVKTCPYYEVAIRNRAAYLASQTNISKFVLSSLDFPTGTAVTIPLRTAAVWFNVAANPSITNVSFALCTTSSSCGGSTPVSPGGVYQVNDPSLTNRFIKITATHSIPVGSPATIVTASNSAQQTVIGKGYTTIDVTGYSGDTQVRQIYTVRNGKPFLSETTGVFDQYGILK
jgi:Tfp pilus assembly protein PilX